MRYRSWILVCTICVMGTDTVANAQLFGTRSIGKPLRPGTRPGTSGTGTVTGAERFIRGNRNPAEFVGSDRGDVQGFVGSGQARQAGPIVSSTTGLRDRPDRTSQINRPLAPPDSKGMYLPTLNLDFEVTGRSVSDTQRRLTDQLSKSSRFSPDCRFEVLVEERTAILKGEVSSLKERDLAELAVLVEPGISEVRNEIEVVKAIPVPPAPKPDSRPPQTDPTNPQ